MTDHEIAATKTTYVVERYSHGVSPVFAVLAALLTLILCFGNCSAIALADDTGTTNDATGGDSSSDTSGTTSTFTDDVTDVNNLFGSDLTKVTDAIKTTKDETGVTVRLMYIPSFGTTSKPAKWASDVLEAMSPAKNTVMLAVASNDGNLVVAVSSNSEEWLKKQQTVDDLSKAAADPLLESTPDWAGSAIAMMDELVKQSKTATSSSSVTVGIVVMVVVLAVLVTIIAAAIVIRRRIKRKVMRMAAERRKNAADSGEETGDDEEHLSRKEIRMRRKAGMWKQ
ncbi:TPM domain-containing protein [Bifidobacterium sp. SO1]|uniref:TPM domain-containing protein n=1 Tax=Bifidobacterium sp. SO1 TaxID=2809029 RepID=UPI001BDCC6F4|nr:TPM domain-containing protein [Bifidobacterium sp. SO1]MBT1161074.1 TPM domain-containing protein [Bifidobacterium sp. SO1]